MDNAAPQHEGTAAPAMENGTGSTTDVGTEFPAASPLIPTGTATTAALDAAIEHGSSTLETSNGEGELPPSSISSSVGEAGTDSGSGSGSGNHHMLLDELEDETVAANDASHAICQPLGTPTAGDLGAADNQSVAGPLTAATASTPMHHRTNSSGNVSIDNNNNSSNSSNNSSNNGSNNGSGNGNGNGNGNSNRKKRLCRFPGCTRVIKSQGHCQRHGAKAKRCKVEGCEKQAQGTHNGMCKRHWRAVHFPDQVAAKAEAERKKQEEEQPPPPVGESVYDTILPASIAYRPSSISVMAVEKNVKEAAMAAAATGAGAGTGTSEPSAAVSGTDETTQIGPHEGGDASSSNNNHKVASTTSSHPSTNNIVSAMPLVTFLRDGALHKEVGWHRQAERRARGMFECPSLSCQLEPWEKQLALVEILLLSGGTPHANFKDLAHAWGRERGFHQVLASSVCTRRGEVERKKRSDAGKRGIVATSVAASVSTCTASAAASAAATSASASASASAAVPHRKRAKYNTLQPQPQQQQQPQQQPLQQQMQPSQQQQQQQQLQHHQMQQVHFQQQMQHQVQMQQQQLQQEQLQQQPTTSLVPLPEAQPTQHLPELATATTNTNTNTNTIIAMSSAAPNTVLSPTNNDGSATSSNDNCNTAASVAGNSNTEGAIMISTNHGASAGVAMGESTGIP